MYTTMFDENRHPEGDGSDKGPGVIAIVLSAVFITAILAL